MEEEAKQSLKLKTQHSSLRLGFHSFSSAAKDGCLIKHETRTPGRAFSPPDLPDLSSMLLHQPQTGL